jgi:valyl-tRNA synthetase
LYYVRYPLLENNEKYITVATTRPETILGDTAVAVNPTDERFKEVVGKSVILPIINREIPIIADDAVSCEFGTGAVKITPAHDPVDFEVASRQGLPIINILNRDGTMNQKAGPYQGLDRFDCRKAILKDLDALGLLANIEDYEHAVGHCHRCRTLIEPLASLQWFVKTEKLAKPAIEAVSSGHIKIIPERFTKIYLNWMANIRDWCISRQLWWGHRIPVWYCNDCSEMFSSIEEPEKCRKCKSKNIKQDDDVLDTWFSSGLWPHSTLGWPNQTEDLEYFYPTSVMETAYDILFFWVARMIMMGIEDTGEIPFEIVYLHGLIRDNKGEKMSKTHGNVVDPLEAIAKYGTDALRFALIWGTTPGNDSKLGVSKLEAGRNFANKIWNASRFVLKSIKANSKIEINNIDLSTEDRWILSRLNHTIDDVSELLCRFQFSEALRQIHDFIWADFCDWYIEISKWRLHSNGSHSVIPVLFNVLLTSLKLLHPFMPFVTEEIWQNVRVTRLNDRSFNESIMIAEYPKVDKSKFDDKAESIVINLTDIIRTIRNVRIENNVGASKWISAKLYIGKIFTEIKPYMPIIELLTRTKIIELKEERFEGEAEESEFLVILNEVDIVVSIQGIVDLASFKEHTKTEIEQLEILIKDYSTRLRDSAFLTKAPDMVVKRHKIKLAEMEERLNRLTHSS